jgi:hypothetical protein
MTACPHGFRIVGSPRNERRPTRWAVAFGAYAECDPRATCEQESYLSAFTFGADFAAHLRRRRTPKGLPESVQCFAPWVWWDIDRAGDLPAAKADAVRLALSLEQQFAIDPEDLLLFFSGSKGYHVGLATSLWRCEPSADFHRVARAFCQQAAQVADVATDPSIYDRVHLLRAPNSRHPKTGLHKVRVSVEDLMHLSPEAIRQRAAEPMEFEIPTPTRCDWNLQNAWTDAAEQVRQQAEAVAQARQDGLLATNAKMNRLTLDFIRYGAEQGGQGEQADKTAGDGRHRRLFSAAANLAEFGCPPNLAHALLTEPGLDCGLSPSDVRRQIDCGLSHAGRGQEGGAA